MTRSFFSSVLPTRDPPKLEENTLNKRDPSVRSDDLAPDDGTGDGEPADGTPVDEEPINPSSAWNPTAVFRFVGLGTELAGFTLVFAGLGYLADRTFQNPKPYGTALGAMIGFSLGMMRFIQQARTSDD